MDNITGGQVNTQEETCKV